VAIGGCDKNMPGAMIAIARLNIPSIFVYGGTIKPGHFNGEDLTIVSAFEAVGQILRGQDQRGSTVRDRATCVSGSRVVRRYVHREHDVVRDRSDGIDRFPILQRWRLIDDEVSRTQRLRQRRARACRCESRFFRDNY
jgi:hypothetical protein